MPPGLFNGRRRIWLSCAVIVALMLIFVLWPAPKEPPAPPLPSPNGYDDFIKAGELLASVKGDYTKMSAEELRAYVGTNQEPLRLARLGLSRECRVPTEDSMAYIQKHTQDLSSIKRIAQLLSAEGRSAEAEKRYEDAAAIHLEIMRLGQASVHDGLMIDKLLGVAVENIGLEGLERILDRLDNSACRSNLVTLTAIDQRADNAEVYLKRDRQWGRKATGTGPLSAWFQAAVMSRSLIPYRQANQKFTAKLSTTDQRRRRLIQQMQARVEKPETSTP